MTSSPTPRVTLTSPLTSALVSPKLDMCVSRILVLLLISSQMSSIVTETSFEISAPVSTAYVQAKTGTSLSLQLSWKLNYGKYTKDDFAYTLQHKWKKVMGGEGMNTVSQEYPTECVPESKFGPVQCGTKNFAGRIHMYITTYHEAGNCAGWCLRLRLSGPTGQLSR
jgi:hypothetical protein